MLYCVAYFNICVHNIAIHFFTFTLLHMLVSNALIPPCASFLRACRSKYMYLVCLSRKLTKHTYFVAYLVVGFHIYMYSYLT